MLVERVTTGDRVYYYRCGVVGGRKWHCRICVDGVRSCGLLLLLAGTEEWVSNQGGDYGLLGKEWIDLRKVSDALHGVASVVRVCSSRESYYGGSIIRQMRALT